MNPIIPCPARHTAQEIATEYLRARIKHAPMHGAHEGYAIMLEEVDELWDEIKKREPSKAEMRKEAIQIAAMALAFVMEVCDGKDPYVMGVGGLTNDRET